MPHDPVRVGHDDGQQRRERPQHQGGDEVVDLVVVGEVLEVHDQLDLGDDERGGGEEEQHAEQDHVDQDALMYFFSSEYISLTNDKKQFTLTRKNR